MAASVWMPSEITEPFGDCSWRFVADTMPDVTEKS